MITSSVISRDSYGPGKDFPMLMEHKNASGLIALRTENDLIVLVISKNTIQAEPWHFGKSCKEFEFLFKPFCGSIQINSLL